MQSSQCRWWASISRTPRSIAVDRLGPRDPVSRPPMPGTPTPPRPSACASCGATATASGRNGCRESRLTRSRRSRSCRRSLVRIRNERVRPALPLYPLFLENLLSRKNRREEGGRNYLLWIVTGSWTHGSRSRLLPLTNPPFPVPQSAHYLEKRVVLRAVLALLQALRTAWSYELNIFFERALGAAASSGESRRAGPAFRAGARGEAK
jgi:hypothetical protein